MLKFRIHYINPLFLGNDWDTRKVEPAQRFIIVGPKEVHSEIETLLKNSGIDKGHKFIEANEEQLKTGKVRISNPGDYNHILFDTSAISYDTVLKTLQNLKGQSLKIATYSPKTKILITDGVIYNTNGTIEI